jgi:hypothetical protein
MESSRGYVALAVTADGWQIRMLLAFPLHVQLCISDLRTDSNDRNSIDRFEVIGEVNKFAGHVQRAFLFRPTRFLTYAPT